MRLVNRLALALSAVVLAACQVSGPAGTRQLSAEELRQRTSETTTYGTVPVNGQTFITFVSADGTIVKTRMSSGLTDEGTLRVTDDGKVCSKFKTIRGGTENCFTVWTDGTKRYNITPSGTTASIVEKTVPGNPENL